MSTDAIGTSAYSSTVGGVTGTTKQTSGSSNTTGLSDTEQKFLTEMRKSPAQRIREQWLKAHNLTEDDLADKSPEERKAIEYTIAEEIKKKVTGDSDRRGAMLDVSA